MSVRERLHDSLMMATVVGPVRPDVIAALSDALTAQVASADGVMHQRSWGGKVAWSRLGAESATRRAAGMVRTFPDGLSPAELATATSPREVGELPFLIGVSGSWVCFSVPHDLFDGSSAWAQIIQIAERATGTVPEPMKPALRRPVLSTLRAAGLLDRDALRAARDLRRTAERSTVLPPQFAEPIGIDDARRRAGEVTVLITGAELERIEKLESPRQSASTVTGRSTRGMKLVAVVLEALEQSVPDGIDYRLRMPIDLRRYAPRGIRVDGPFASAYPVGTLRTGDNTAIALTSRVASIATSKAPLAALVADMIGYTKTRVMNPLRTRSTAPETRDSVDITFSVLPVRLPDTMWVDQDDRHVSAYQFHPRQSTAPFVQIAEMGSRVLVSIWDETGTVDFVRFRAAVARVIAARENAESRS